MIITLTTDFGLTDPFVGVMKGVILGIAPHARLVDISHDVPSYDIAAGAWTLASAAAYFPEGTIHVAVVDPGVGGRRHPIAIVAGGHVFIGPDNGVLSLAARMLEPNHTEKSRVSARRITNEAWFRHPVSPTFHGRDIFSPVAARLACGAEFESVGPALDRIVELDVPGKSAGARILAIDKFGNIITSLRANELEGGFALRIGGREVRISRSSYEEAAPGELFAITGSAGFIEIALREDSAAIRLSARRGDQIEVETGGSNH